MVPHGTKQSSRLLTNRSLEALKPGREASDAAVKGLRARRQGARIVLFLRYRAPLDGRLRKLDIGDWPTLPLDEARRRAAAQRDLLVRGIDPHEHRAQVLAVRRAEAAARLEIATLADRFLAGEARRLAPATTARYRRCLAIAGEVLGADRDSATVTRGEATALLDDVAAKSGPRAAGHVHAAARAAWQWALDRELLLANPWSRLKIARRLKPGRRLRTLNDAELAVFVRRLEAALPLHYGMAASVILHTACRPGEACGAEWKEIDLDAGTWRIPAARRKSRREHLAPLVPAIVEGLRAHRASLGAGRHRYVFPADNGAGCLQTSALGHGLAAAAERNDEARRLPKVAPHDLRRSVATGLQRLGVASDVVEAVLGHELGAGRALGHYAHHGYEEEKRAALERWAAHIARTR